jgi:ketosteroid isomerase-like protein
VERSDELRDLFLRFYDALAKGDAGFFDHHFSRDADVRGIGTDPHEWWPGPRVAEVFKEQIEAIGGGMALKAGDPEAYAEGSVGWVADRATFTLPDGGELQLRFTGVLHREDGDWKFVQSHGSLGVANEESFGEELPT